MISFIVPAFNEELELPATLAAIHSAAADAQQEYEVIVVDDASTDATVAIAEQHGAKVVSIDRRQIAAARNAGARAALGDTLFFVDADTRINSRHVMGGLAAMRSGFSGGGARLIAEGQIPRWGEVFVKLICAIYFALKLAAGSFIFTSRRNYDAVGGFNEQFFIGEEVYFSFALKRLGRFTILTEPVITSGRKLRMYSGRRILMNMMSILLHGPRAARSRRRLDLWYDGKRETGPT